MAGAVRMQHGGCAEALLCRQREGLRNSSGARAAGLVRNRRSGPAHGKGGRLALALVLLQAPAQLSKLQEAAKATHDHHVTSCTAGTASTASTATAASLVSRAFAVEAWWRCRHQLWLERAFLQLLVLLAPASSFEARLACPLQRGDALTHAFRVRCRRDAERCPCSSCSSSSYSLRCVAIAAAVDAVAVLAAAAAAPFRSEVGAERVRRSKLRICQRHSAESGAAARVVARKLVHRVRHAVQARVAVEGGLEGELAVEGLRRGSLPRPLLLRVSNPQARRALRRRLVNALGARHSEHHICIADVGGEGPARGGSGGSGFPCRAGALQLRQQLLPLHK